MIIDQNTVVSLHYKLQEDNAEGELIEETNGGDPLTFLFGVGQMIPEFEANLEGKSAGDEFAFGILHTDAYGPYDDDAVAALPLSVFMFEGELDTEMLQPGRTIPLRDEEGRLLYGTVEEIRENEVVMDFNHPMAGLDLYFTGRIESVREATQEEIDHNHVHGAGGHEH
ncbi:MAG: peptidylprolyl isomerase [Saprospiraceae bacterium]|nr:peptidylprolyl isomerase [Saprospiraceae bacterium]